MANPENSIVENGNEVPQHKPQPESEAVRVPGIELPAPPAAKQPRNQHLKVAEPKSEQFAGRATKTEYDLIQQVMKANGCTDIVRLMLLSIKYHQKDVLSSFKLK